MSTTPDNVTAFADYMLSNRKFNNQAQAVKTNEKYDASDAVVSRELASSIRDMQANLSTRLLDITTQLKKSNEYLNTADKRSENYTLTMESMARNIETFTNDRNPEIASMTNKDGIIDDPLVSFFQDHEYIPVKILNVDEMPSSGGGVGNMLGGALGAAAGGALLRSVGAGALTLLEGAAAVVAAPEVLAGAAAVAAAAAVGYGAYKLWEWGSEPTGDPNAGPAAKAPNRADAYRIAREQENASADEGGFSLWNPSTWLGAGSTSNYSGGQMGPTQSYVPDATLTGKENAVLGMISEREGATNPDVIFGDTNSTPGSGKYSKALGLDKKPLTSMTINEVLAMQKDLTAMTAADGIAGGVGTSAVGTGQFVRGTLIENLRRLNIPESEWGTMKFDANLQKRLTLANFGATVGDPNADPSTWNTYKLGKQWESFDTSKGFAGLTAAEMESVRSASAQPAAVASNTATSNTASFVDRISNTLNNLSKTTTLNRDAPAPKPTVTTPTNNGAQFTPASYQPEAVPGTPDSTNPLPAIDNMFAKLFDESALFGRASITV